MAIDKADTTWVLVNYLCLVSIPIYILHYGDHK